MSDAVVKDRAHHEHGDGHHDSGSIKVFGFWIYLMTDLVLFATLFAAFAVLRHNIADGPAASSIFELKDVLIETFALLLSSVTFGFAMLAMYRGESTKVNAWLFITFIFGLIFVGMEISEFHHLISQGFTPERSGFLSSFFLLVSTHGLHVTAGLIWMITMMIQIARNGITPVNKTRMMCLSLFWHFLDIVWICVFSIVYLFGVMKV